MPGKSSWSDPPHEVSAIRALITRALDSVCAEGRRVGDAKYGVYLFYDYDGEPIYVGRTSERLRVRIRRHLTNRRTDAAAMSVLDPFEVAEIEMWPLWELEDIPKKEALWQLGRLEYSVYQRALLNSVFSALLNEKDIPQTEEIELPPSYRSSIIPEEVRQFRSHPDIRIARRASTIASLAGIISERSPSQGLRRTLIVQAQRLEWLARQRYESLLKGRLHGDAQNGP